MLHEVITVTIQENQRKVPMRGYSAGHLLALSDPPAYKGPDGSRGKVPDAAAPLADGERWVDDGWRVSIGDETDADGWRYARTFGATGHATRGLTDVCRFRTWTRAKKRLVALDTGLPTAGAPPAPPAASPPPPEIPPEKAFARAMAMAPADRHARVVALAMQISVADAAADAKERATRARSAEAKAALEAEAEACRREAATALEFAQKLEGAARTLKLAAAAAATAREATARKRLALPDYDPANVLRGEDGLCVGVKDATLERCAGRLIISAEPTEAGARATLSRRGALTRLVASVVRAAALDEAQCLRAVRDALARAPAVARRAPGATVGTVVGSLGNRTGGRARRGDGAGGWGPGPSCCALVLF